MSFNETIAHLEREMERLAIECENNWNPFAQAKFLALQRLLDKARDEAGVAATEE